MLGNHILFTSRGFDAETGLYYHRARYLDPTTGRWTTQDPLGFAAGDTNLYRYVGNRATLSTDPSGYLEQPPLWARFVNSWDAVLGNQHTGWFAQTSNFFAGWGDTLSLGGTRYIRRGIGYDDVVDHHSGADFGGQIVGPGHVYLIGYGAGGFAPQAGVWAYRSAKGYTGVTTVYGVGRSSYILVTDPSSFGLGDALAFVPAAGYTTNFARLGREISFGRNFRIAPFGNRTGHPIGRWPHYHRRIVDANGNTIPGGGIGNHRPWSMSSDVDTESPSIYH
jgi:RHS repeat-associated protein